MSTIFIKLIENNESSVTIDYSFNNESYENSITFKKDTLELSSINSITTTLDQKSNDDFSNHILEKVCSFVINKLKYGGEIKLKETLSIDDDPKMKDYFINNVLETVKKILPSHTIKSISYADYSFEVTKDDKLAFILQFPIDSTMCAIFNTTYDGKGYNLTFNTDYISTNNSSSINYDIVKDLEEANGDLYRITEKIINYVKSN